MRKLPLVHVGILGLLTAAVVTSIPLVQAAGGGGSASALIPIAPCRLVDTRAASAVGDRATPVGQGEVVELADTEPCDRRAVGVRVPHTRSPDSEVPRAWP